MQYDPVRVLIIDDCEADFYLVAGALEDVETPYVVHRAATYEAGLGALAEPCHDVYLLSDRLGSESGIELLEHAREVGIDVPVIMLGTAFDSSGDLSGDGQRSNGQTHDAVALQAGATDYLLKDELTPEALERSIRYARERQHLLTKLARAATYDSLTGLANRRHFGESLRRGLARASRNRTRLGLLFLDLDHFKEVNDQHGHDAGDRLLKVVAQRLHACVRAGDLVARIGGDEFAILLHELDQASSAGKVAAKIIERIAEPVDLLSENASVGVSIGIAVSAGSGDDAHELMKAADTAMYAAKARGRNSYQFFARHMQEQAVHRAQLRSELICALANDGFHLVYQPQVEGFSGRLVGMECLIRWRYNNQDRSPAQFIPIAEECGVIGPIGDWVLAGACAQFQQWIQADLVPDGVTLSVNISVHQLTRNSIMAGLERALHASGLDPRRLELEITETARMRDLQTAASVLAQIHAMGVRISLDDFGTGYSALADVKLLPVQGLKLDRSFVQGALVNRTDAAVLNATIAFAHTLGLTLIAEGVETPDQRKLLLRSRCAIMQGWLFYPALGASDMRNLLLAESRVSRRRDPNIGPTGLLGLISSTGETITHLRNR